MNQEASKKIPSANIFMWWKITNEELSEQVEGYDKLGFFKTARKVASALLLLSAALTFMLMAFGKISVDSYLDIALFLGLAIFDYRGEKWALIASMILWTLEKLYSASQAPALAVVHIIWWCFYMRAFYLAYKVEKKRAGPSSDDLLDKK